MTTGWPCGERGTVNGPLVPNNDGGYFPAVYKVGNEDTAIRLGSISASLNDTDDAAAIAALGLELSEMESHAKTNYCCGGGGGQFLIERAAPLRAKAFEIKMHEVDATGAQTNRGQASAAVQGGDRGGADFDEVLAARQQLFLSHPEQMGGELVGHVGTRVRRAENVAARNVDFVRQRQRYGGAS